MHELAIPICPVQLGRWYHFVITYDGVAIRVYIDSLLTLTVETEAAMQVKTDTYNMHREDERKDVFAKEAQAVAGLKEAAQKKAEEYLNSKEGKLVVKEKAKLLMKSSEFMDEDLGAAATSGGDVLQLKKEEANRRVMQKYVSDVYVESVRESAAHFKQIKDELDDKRRRTEEDLALASVRPLRIGANKDNKNFFDGHISCLSIYTTCLDSDDIETHYASAFTTNSQEAQRLYSLSAALFEEALIFAADDPLLLQNYASSLCEYLKIELTSTTEGAMLKGKAKVKAAIVDFTDRMVPLGIAEIISKLPVEVHFSDLVSFGFLNIIKIDSHFFAKGLGMSRKDLIQFPKKFGLDLTGSPELYTRAAARMYQEVMIDSTLAYVYGDTDLSWVKWLKSPALIVAVVSQMQEDNQAQTVNVGELFKQESNGGKNPLKDSIYDGDVQV